MAKSFYILFDKILQEEIKAHVSGKKSIFLTKNQIKNPPTIKLKDSTCPFCADLLPNPLPEKIRLLLRKIANQNGTPTSEDRLTFCEIHQAETTIDPNGIHKVAPKKPVDYLQEVLVPETALRLISQDRGGLKLELAQEIIDDSADFGDYVHSE
ncbi:hypothetical protein C2G38_2042799 [Gigaspora rosea]|uniref:Restriction of telomere capping protein 4 n=1 Tax=Gigaspora rosea TaxID=44941 RepID=A0A397UP43_9GLOM|nr:hypothetical protein C2G38_2042799 [Gigaspora rosea]